ncbi:MAG: tyrosine-type recombinase/integrase [Planctomycetes bacterium]|nr:tyrosine-type recombinase/integrase [Planctomycetota bacterium]
MTEIDGQRLTELLAEAEEWLASLAGEAGLSRNTVSAYRRDLVRAAGLLAAAGCDSWLEVGSSEVAEVLAGVREAGAAPATQARLLAALRGLFRFLKAEGRLEGRDPTRSGGKLHLWRRLPGVLGVDQALRLLNAPPEEGWCGMRDRALLALLYGGGLRVSEACGLRLADLSLRLGGKDGPGLLRVLGKGGKERLVPFGGRARDRLEHWIQLGRPGRPGRSPLVLLSKNGKALDRHRAWRIVRRWAVVAGLPATVHPHILRHSCATHLLAGGGDLRSVQEFLGHADLRTTERYTHVDVDELQSAHRLHHPRG